MKAIIFAILFVSAVYAQDGEVEIDEAQFPMMMNPMMMNPMMGGMPMGGMNNMNMGGMSMGMDGNAAGYQTDYRLPCSNSCSCQQRCMPMVQCHCVCPPRCPQTTTQPITASPPPILNEPSCPNGAPARHLPDCCFNGGRGMFCCLNGANNLHCCLNGANNPWCSLPTQPPVVFPPTSEPGNDCNQCVCQPCIPWVPCPPCPCQSRCGGGGWGK